MAIRGGVGSGDGGVSGSGWVLLGSVVVVRWVVG